MQVELPIDETLARYAKKAGAELVRRVFEEAFKRLLANSAAPGALSRGDAELLDAAGLVEPDDGTVAFAAGAASAAEQASLFANALTVAEAAEALGVSTGRVRQQVGARELYAMRDGKTSRLPRFQFLDTAEGLQRVPNSGPVLQALPRELSAMAIARWFTMPNDELRSAPDAAPLSPRQWLVEGHPADDVVSLAGWLAGEPQGEPQESTGSATTVAELNDGITALREAGDEAALRSLARTLQRLRPDGGR